MLSRKKTSSSPIERAPYRLAMMIGGIEKCHLIIANPDATGYYLESSFPLGLPIDIVDFIHQHCRCTYCKASVSRDLNRCKCSKLKSPNMHLDVEYPAEINRSVFKPILKREESRIKTFKRKQRIKANGGAYTKNDIAILYQLQEGLCYFCGEPFVEYAIGNSYHADHYLPVYDGGKSDPSNLVLTCPSCNLRKGAMHGDSFKRIAKKTRSLDIGRKLGKIRRKVNAFRASYNVAGNKGDLEA